MAIKQDLIVDQGADFIHKVYLIDTSGNPFDITGYSANAQIRRNFTSNSYIDISINLDHVNGLVAMSMNADTTALLTQTRYVYDLDLSSNNVVSRIVEGVVNVNPGVTR